VKIQTGIAEACKAEADRLAKKAKAVTNKINFLKNFYLDTMRLKSVKKISGEVYTISIRESKKVAVTFDLSQIPELYLRRKEEVEADKQTIKEALKDGIKIPGCELVPSYSLSIK
jgi:hypothetical protein